MSTVVCQGLQSCLESQLIEPARTLRLKLASPKPHFSLSLGLAVKPCMLESDANYEELSKKTSNLDDNHISSNPDLGGWSFLQALSNTSQSPKEAMEKENLYVHPLVKRSLSTLSEKSLELCTENLGSETGSDIIENNIFSFSSSDSDGGYSPTREQPQSRQLTGARKVKARNFPPPLTTISGSNSLHVRPHREGGRLIIKAVAAPSTHSCFQAERSHGRLRLSFLKNYCPTFDSEVAAEENERSFEDKENEGIDNEANNEKEEEEEEEEEEEDEGESDVYMSTHEDMDGNSLDVGVEMGIEKFQRPSRCKEGGHANEGLLNWEPFWVATS